MNGYTLDDYIADVQRSLIPFSVNDDKSKLIGQELHKATFLIFEILKTTENEKFFKAYISRDLLPKPSDLDCMDVYNRKLERLHANDPDEYSRLAALPNHDVWHKWQSPERAYKFLTGLLTKYGEKQITPNLGATAVIYQAWKQGKFYQKWYANGADTDFQVLQKFIAKNLFIENYEFSDETRLESLLNDMAFDLGIEATDKLDGKPKKAQVNKNMSFDGKDGEPWIIYSDREFICTEMSIIHKVQYKIVTEGGIDKKYYFVHYPLILDNYWFIGFGYFLAEKSNNDSESSAELFNINKYFKCLDLLNKTFGTPLKDSLRNQVLKDVDWQKTISIESLLVYLRQYFACFGFDVATDSHEHLVNSDKYIFEADKFKDRITEGKRDYHLPNDHIIIVTVPKWVKQNYSFYLENEIIALCEAINSEKDNAERIKALTEKHGSNAASVSIMSRNLSHNDGSHCIAYWIVEIGEMIEKVVSSEGDDSENILGRSLLKSKSLFQYLQHRMDFLAEVSTSVPCSEVSLDFISDILNPTFIKPMAGENDFEIGNNKYQLKRSVLLEYIAKSEGLNLHNNIVPIISTKQSRRVSIPNGIVGNHAIYSIFENYLRNAAKHYIGTVINAADSLEVASQKSISAIKSAYEYYDYLSSNTTNHYVTDKPLPFESEIANINNATDVNACFLAIKSLHDFQNSDSRIPIILIELAEDDKYGEDYYAMTLWDMRENSCNQKIVSDLRKYLPGSKAKERLLSVNGELQSGGWGIKEMLISANFLRKNSTDKLFETIKYGPDDKEPPLIEILCGSNNCYDLPGQCDQTVCIRKKSPFAGRLGWRFYLRKPKDLIIASDHEVSGRGNIGTNFEIKVNKINDIRSVMPYRMLLVNKGERGKYETDPNAPCRIREDGDIQRFYKIAEDDLPLDGIDSTYLDYYENFIKEVILPPENSFPKLIFLGEKANDYKELFADELTKIYGQSIEPAKLNGTEGKTAIFYYHAKSYFSKQPKGIWERFVKEHNCLYFQDLSGGHSFNQRVSNAGIEGMKPTLKKHLLFELMESVITKVIIIDERVSTWASQNWMDGIPLRRVLEKMRVFIVDVRLDDVTYDDLLSKLNVVTEEQHHFFVVHQGVLEKIDKVEEGSTEKLFTSNVVKNCLWKVVDSGRGIQKEKFEQYSQYGVRFIEISAMLKMLDNFDKHALVQALFASRYPMQNWESPRE